MNAFLMPTVLRKGKWDGMKEQRAGNWQLSV